MNDSTEKSSRTRPRVRASARGRASERPFFSALMNGKKNPTREMTPQVGGISEQR
jgi:hypothetical protein